ncbi:ankyrin repeat protein (macronuclear) [Tetrahymena thermophila SB210]|uniref:Ankyrin repeat protein n=1 Tax=Tetrahymena thermophila (strain SB210) TaxID=312017 RepID=I7MAS0_TETTS|nr:ankyrin repeat protein [Tetrahymena thermophila SB210]EAS05968.3 ankyrin repeat protein [Tetrahymena thermophila SB210]|eukprot:XP_001026213.3 ankyrin repeat protein [Tetrahymena thermophila SB210]
MKNNKSKQNNLILKQMKVIYICVQNEDLQRLKMIQDLEKYFDMEYTDYGWNILHLAAWYKSTNVMKFILQNPKAAELVNSKDKNQETPLHLAFFTQAKGCIQLLMEHGADSQSLNIVQQIPVQTMNAPRENQIKTLLDLQKTLTNESQFNSISPYIQKLKQELDMERGSTTVPQDFMSKIKIENFSGAKVDNQIMDEDDQFINSNLHSQQGQIKDQNILSFQSAANQYNEDIAVFSYFGSQQNLNYQQQQPKLEQLISDNKKNKGEDVDLEEQKDETDTIENYKMQTNKNQTSSKQIQIKKNMEESDIQDEQKQININYFQSRIRKFTNESLTNI